MNPPSSRSERDTRLATYGTLAPGRKNHAQVQSVGGEWTAGKIRGRLIEAGWGAEYGYPGLVIDPDGDEIDVFLLTADGLADHWPHLDAFEGSGYRRAEVEVELPGGSVSAWIYVLSEETLSDGE